MDILILVGLTLLNSCFAMSEIAIINARKARLELIASTGSRAATAALTLKNDPTLFLSALQIGITSIGLLTGIYGESLFSPPLSSWLQDQGLSLNNSHLIATISVVAIITYFSIVIGELIPKRIAQVHSESIACLIARPMLLLIYLTRPFIWLLSSSTNMALQLMQINMHTNSSSITEDEIHTILEESSEAGIIEQHEHTLVRNVFHLDKRSLSSLMMPRSEILYLDLTLPLEENMLRMVSYGHDLLPVCNGSLSEVVGIINVHKVFHAYFTDQAIDLTAFIQEGSLLPETLNGLELLNHFRSTSEHMVLVVDEYGELQGLVTKQDLLEALAGDFLPSDGEDEWTFLRDDGSWLLNGLIPLQELKDSLKLSSLPQESQHHCHTLGGLMMLLLGRIPHTGDKVILEQWQLEIIKMDKLRVDKIIATPIT